MQATNCSSWTTSEAAKNTAMAQSRCVRDSPLTPFRIQKTSRVHLVVGISRLLATGQRGDTGTQYG